MHNAKILMLFAAGFGTRMDKAARNIPKPLLEIQGKPLLYWNLDYALKHNFKRIIINTHYLHQEIEKAVSRYKQIRTNLPEIITIYEPVILETGGGIKNALNFIHDNSVFTLNSDSIIVSEENYFGKMQDFWNPEKMDILMLVNKIESCIGYCGQGDFYLTENNKLYRGNAPRPYMFIGVHLLKTHIIENYPENIFSLKEFYEDSQIKIYGYNYGHTWYHLTYPEDITLAESEIENRHNTKNFYSS